METALAIAAIAIASLTLAYVVLSGQRQCRQLGAQIKALSDQTDLLRKQLLSEVYEQAQVRGLEFFLPAKAQRPIAVFEGIQKEDGEVILGKEIKISKRWVTELHVRFSFAAPQKLRGIVWGFPADRGYPHIVEYRKAFRVEILSEFQQEIYKDWHGHWHMEFPFPRFLPKDFCFVLSFTVKGDSTGRFPLEFEIITDEGKEPFRGTLSVEVTD